MTSDEAREMAINGMNYAAYRETDSSLHDSDKNRVFGSEHYKTDRPYLETAGWEITDGTTTIRVDPYLSRIRGPVPPGGGSGHPIAGDTRRVYTWSDIATPDVAAINAHIQRADFVLVTHTHHDHILQVPLQCARHRVMCLVLASGDPELASLSWSCLRLIDDPCALAQSEIR